MLLTASIAVCANLVVRSSMEQATMLEWGEGSSLQAGRAGHSPADHLPSRPTAHAHNSRLAVLGMSEKGLGWRPKIQGQGHRPWLKACWVLAPLLGTIINVVPFKAFS